MVQAELRPLIIGNEGRVGFVSGFIFAGFVGVAPATSRDLAGP